MDGDEEGGRTKNGKCDDEGEEEGQYGCRQMDTNEDEGKAHERGWNRTKQTMKKATRKEMERKKETAQTYPVSPIPEFPSRKGGMVSTSELESQDVSDVTAAGEYDTMILKHQRRLTCSP